MPESKETLPGNLRNLMSLLDNLQDLKAKDSAYCSLLLHAPAWPVAYGKLLLQKRTDTVKIAEEDAVYNECCISAYIKAALFFMK